ncbi:MAG: TonB-dependent receptor, partial [Bacteroidales bacterium]|nr:TonB-dependent receptor [Bacteroidales bacterium]
MKKIIIPLLFIIAIIISPGIIFGQTATIKGFVYEKETGEPVIFTNVYLNKTSYGAATDVNGYYAISLVPVGTYKLMVTSVGYDTLHETISLKADQILNKTLFLKQGAYTLETVNISAEKHEMRTETHTSVVKITPKRIKQIPSIGGQPDLAQYLQVLPGVVFTGDQGGQLYIRGGSPIQNKVILDGMIIYNPFHSIGLFSVFDTDIIRNADIFTGGFGAEYGGRISSVMDITTRDGNKKRIAGKIGASTFGSKIMVEGPLKKQDENNSSSISFILSVKNSYLEQSSEILYDYIDTAGLPFNYTDVYGKLSINGSNGSKVNFFGFNFNDKVNNYKALSDFNWQSSGGGTNVVLIPGKSSVLLEGHVAYSNYKISLNEETNPPRTSEINGFNAGLDFTYFLGKNEIKYGLEMLGFSTDYYFINSVGRVIRQAENTTELALYIKSKIIKGKFLIEPSFRLQWYASLSTISPEPRLAFKYNASNSIRLKFAMGLYSQNLISARSDRDVVNLFYGFLSGPDNLPSTFDGEDVTHKLQKSEHLIVGVEYDLNKYTTINLEAYYKNFSQLTNLNRNKIYDEAKNTGAPDLLKKDFIIEIGDAEGIDISIKYDKNQLYFWAVYSLAYVNKFYENTNHSLVKYVPHYDRRHNVNLVMAYKFGDEYCWEFNARWNFGTGFPFTQTLGYYEKIKFENGINSNYITQNGELGILFAELNQGRLPTYHRLDINLKRSITLGKHSALELNASVTNAYDRKNIFYIDRITNERVNQLPFMPSFGM